MCLCSPPWPNPAHDKVQDFPSTQFLTLGLLLSHLAIPASPSDCLFCCAITSTNDSPLLNTLHTHTGTESERERERMRYILKLIINAANHAVRNALMYNTYVDKSYSCTQQPSIGQPATSPTQASLYVSCYVKLGLVGQTKPSLVPNSTNTALKHCTVLLQCCHQLFFQREIRNWPCDG